MKPTFVIPWYGADVTGGAETEARKTVEGLQRLAGVEVEVLTTCVQDFHSVWSINARPEGSSRLMAFQYGAFQCVPGTRRLLMP